MSTSASVYTIDHQDNTNVSAIRDVVLDLHSQIKRGDVVHMKNPGWDSEIYVYDGQDLHHLQGECPFPESMKVVTEFPIQYWHNSTDIIDGQWEVAFDFPLFRDQIVDNLAADSDSDGDVTRVFSSFTHNDVSYTLVFDRLGTWNDEIKARLILALDSGEGYTFHPYPIETSSNEEYDPNTLYCCPNKDTWEEQLDEDEE